jgi:hypothetical protein
MAGQCNASGSGTDGDNKANKSPFLIDTLGAFELDNERTLLDQISFGCPESTNTSNCHKSSL